MAFDIQDYDDLQIYVTDGWREWYIPKFRIFIVVDEPICNIYWTDTEKGASGLTRLLALDYTDVTFGYISPSSALEVKNQLDVYITSAFGGGGGVQSVTGLDTDNTDPLNPIVEIAVDGVTITGDGTPGNPLEADQTDLNTLMSSGILTGGVLSIGVGGAGVATTFTIAAGAGQVVNNTVDPFTVTPVSWAAKVNVAVTNLLTDLVTFVAIDSAGNVIQSSTDFTPQQMRQYIIIGVVVHSNLTTVNAVNQAQIVAYNQGNQLTDLFYSIGLFNVSGNVFSANGANVKLNKSAGSLFRRGSNYTSLSNNPHIVTTASLSPSSLRMQNQTGAGSASTTDVDVANYDVGGVTTAISPANRFSILRIFLFQSNLIAVQRGQAIYQSLAEAKAAIQTETYITNDVLQANGLLRGFLIARANATDFTDPNQAFFISASKFGGTTGAGGLSVSTLQNAYDNSSDPEILTDATRGALTLKRGSAADTDNVIEVLNGANTNTFNVDGNGQINSDSLTASEIVITDGSKNLASAAVATYPSLTELTYVKGVTSAIQTQINNLAVRLYALNITAASTTHTGTAAQTITYAFEIPAGTIGLNDCLEIKTWHRKTTGASGSHTVTVYLNTSNAIGGDALLNTVQGGATTLMMEAFLKWQNSTTAYTAKNAALTPWGSNVGGVPLSYTKNTAASLWVIVTNTLATTTDVVTQYMVEVIHHKNS